MKTGIIILIMLLSMFFSDCGNTQLPELPLPPKEIPLVADDSIIDDMTVGELNQLNSSNIEIIYAPSTGIPRQINGIFSKYKIMSDQDALLALLNVRGILQIPDDCSFCCLEIDNNRVEFQVFTLNQLYKGIVVDGSLFQIVAEKDGTPVSVSGIYQHISDVDIIPALSAESAMKAIQLGQNARISALSLVIYMDENAESHLCWKYETCSNRLTECKIYYVDAHDGNLLISIPTVIS